MKMLHTLLFRPLMAAGTALYLLITSYESSAQGVGINTSTPDPSAALDISATDKGILIPKVNLQNLNDKTSVINPANGLMVFNTNESLRWGVGYYYNKGTAASPSWQGVSDFPVPYTRASADNIMFDLQNYSNNTSSATIHAYSTQGYALSTEGKIKIAGNGQSPGNGKVLTSDANGNATWQSLSLKNKNTFKASGIKGGGSEKTANNTITRIPFAHQDFDPMFNYNDINDSPHSTFIVPVDGIYHFDVKISVSSTGQNVGLSLNKESSGANTVEASEWHSDPRISTNLKLKAGDKIYATVYQTTGDYIFLSLAASESYFTGFLITEL